MKKAGDFFRPFDDGERVPRAEVLIETDVHQFLLTLQSVRIDVDDRGDATARFFCLIHMHERERWAENLIGVQAKTLGDAFHQRRFSGAQRSGEEDDLAAARGGGEATADVPCFSFGMCCILFHRRVMRR